MMHRYRIQKNTTTDPDKMNEVGSTANVCFMTPQKIYCANAGDCRAILVKKNGDIVKLSKDHKPILEEEMERIKAAGHSVRFNRVDGKLALSRAIGDHAYKNNDKLPAEEQAVTYLPEIWDFDRDYENDAFVLIACDGLWDVKTNE